MKSFITILAMLFLLAAPAKADGPYIAAFGGVNFQADIDGDITAPGFAPAPFTVETKTGFVVGGAAGYKWNFTDWSLSVEGEGSYRKNDLDKVAGLSGPLAAAGISTGGDVQIAGIMANVIFAYEPQGTQFVPYVGGGIGVGIVTAEVSFSGLGATVKLVDESDTGFAYQFIAGVGYKITPMLMLGVEYRLFGVTGTEFKPDSSVAAFVPVGTKADLDNILNHAVMVKLTYSF